MIFFSVPLNGVSLIPNDSITKTETETQEFTCFAKSLPLSNLTWRLNGYVLSTSQIPVTTIDTITSKYTYNATKIDNGKRLSCTAVYGLTVFTEDVLINVLCKQIVYYFLASLSWITNIKQMLDIILE